MPERILCSHGYVFMQDSCPGCDAMEETPHEPSIVKVTPRWSKTGKPLARCIHCAKTRSHPIHTQQ